MGSLGLICSRGLFDRLSRAIRRGAVFRCAYVNVSVSTQKCFVVSAWFYVSK